MMSCDLRRPHSPFTFSSFKVASARLRIFAVIIHSSPIRLRCESVLSRPRRRTRDGSVTGLHFGDFCGISPLVGDQLVLLSQRSTLHWTSFPVFPGTLLWEQNTEYLLLILLFRVVVSTEALATRTSDSDVLHLLYVYLPTVCV